MRRERKTINERGPEKRDFEKTRSFYFSAKIPLESIFFFATSCGPSTPHFGGLGESLDRFVGPVAFSGVQNGGFRKKGARERAYKLNERGPMSTPPEEK